jgi:protein phosphatase PTC6
MSLSRSNKAAQGKEATSANAAGGDPQVFYFGIFDGHGGRECADYLKDELHHYIERSASEFGLQSSLKRGPKSTDDPPQGVPSQAGVLPTSDHNKAGKEVLKNVDIKSEKEVLEEAKDHYPEKHDGVIEEPPTVTRVQSAAPVNQKINKAKAIELELALVQEWQETVGGYFRRFKPEFFELPEKHRRNHHRKGHHQTSVTDESGVDLSQQPPPSIETVLMYAFLRCDLDFVIAQAAKPDAAQVPDLPLNDNEVLGKPGVRPARDTIGGPTRFKGGSTASTAMISTPSATPFWHPSSPSTLLVAHVGDTRILLCETSTGLAVPVTTNHHPRSSVESARLRRYAATFVTDSFGEERMSGLANTRSFGDMGSKRIGVSAEPEVVRVELGPAQYSFIVLCSDGVAGTLTDQEVVDVVKEARTPEQAARDVVAFATEVTRDGDNATCLVVRLGGWERRGEGGLGSLGTKEIRDFRRQEATDPRRGRM